MTMKRVDFPVVGSLWEDQITKVNAERTVNMYVTSSYEGKKATYLAPTPGLLATESFTEGGMGRASFVFKNFVYFVQGDSIYRMDNTFIPVVIESHFFDTTEGYVGIAANEFEILFVDGIKCYLWNTNTSTGSDNTGNLPSGIAPLDISFMDGSFILISSTVGYQNRFYISALNDGTSWGITDFALINSRPTILQGVAVLKRRIFFFGEVASELWMDQGAADFRFRRDNNLLLEHGVQAIGSIYEAFDRLFYLSRDASGVGSIMMVAGGITPVPISTRQMDERIQYFSETEKAVGFAYKINGIIFYQINFTAAGKTFVFNASDSEPEKDILLWHEMEMADEGRHLANTHAFYLGKHFVTSYKDTDNNLYEMSSLYLTNNDERIKRMRIARVMSVPTYDRITYGRMQVDMLEGVGAIDQKPLRDISKKPLPTYLDLANASDVSPMIYLSVSEDGGINYDSLGTSTTGNAGQRLHRVLWWDLGTYRDAIFKLEMYNAVPVYILGGAVDMEIQSE